MIIIGGSSHPLLAQQVADKLGCDYIAANTKKFPDQEFKVQIHRDLYAHNVIILQSTARPTNDHLMELLLLADTVKRANCNSITAVIPYFGYSRQDRSSYEYGPISASLVARLIESSGIDKVITVDLHSKQSESFFKMGVINLDPTDLFINAIQKTHGPLSKPASGSQVLGAHGTEDHSVLGVHEDLSTGVTTQLAAEVGLCERSNDYMIISPDIGGLPRAKVMASKLKTDLAIINKTRDSDGNSCMSEVTGSVEGKDCIIIDDIVDTGGTLCEASKILKKSGAKSVKACVTHAVFSEDCINKISQAGFAEFFITDTISHHTLPSFINVLQTSQLIARTLSAL